MATELVDITSEDMKRGLEELKADPQPPSREKSALRRAIVDNLKDIQELVSRGWSRRQICDALKEKLGFKCQYAVFNAYLRQAEEAAKKARTSRKAAQAKAEAEE